MLMLPHCLVVLTVWRFDFFDSCWLLMYPRLFVGCWDLVCPSSCFAASRCAMLWIFSTCPFDFACVELDGYCLLLFHVMLIAAFFHVWDLVFVHVFWFLYDINRSLSQQEYWITQVSGSTIGALIIRIGFWGPLYYSYNKEPQNSIGNYSGPYITESQVSGSTVSPIKFKSDSCQIVLGFPIHYS